jgi:hypothetical protein
MEPNPALNPHTYQNKDCKYIDRSRFFRVLSDDYPSNVEYKPRRPDDDRSTVHFGQRKLHLSEIEFLTNFCKELDEYVEYSLKKASSDVVLIYAGAAPGIHISKLSDMFPFIKFVLIDPADFHVKETERIQIIQEYFTDQMARELKKEYTNQTILFISDIRVFGPGTLNNMPIHYILFSFY